MAQSGEITKKKWGEMSSGGSIEMCGDSVLKNV